MYENPRNSSFLKSLPAVLRSSFRPAHELRDMNRVGTRIFLDFAAIVLYVPRQSRGRGPGAAGPLHSRRQTRAREQRGAPFQRCSQLHTSLIRKSGIIVKSSLRESGDARLQCK
jgi:hypothetical protein